MKTVVYLVILFFTSVLTGYSQNHKLITNVPQEQSLVTGIVSFGKKRAQIEIRLTLKNEKIDKVHFIEISDNKNPLRADVSISNLIGDGNMTRILFDHRIVDRLISLEFDSNFSKNGGDIWITLLKNEIPENQKLSIFKDKNGKFGIYFYDNLIQKRLITFDVGLNFIGFLTFNIKDYILKAH